MVEERVQVVRSALAVVLLQHLQDAPSLLEQGVRPPEARGVLPEYIPHAPEGIHYQGEKSVAFGFHPAVLYYNGIHTLDGYLSWFSQSYKEEFRRLIAPALERNEEKRDYYDGWGGRAYIYPVAGTYEPVRVMPYEEEDIYFDPDVFAEMSGKYVFSRVKISNAEEMNLELQGVYQNEKTPYVIYVYCLGE